MEMGNGEVEWGGGGAGQKSEMEVGQGWALYGEVR